MIYGYYSSRDPDAGDDGQAIHIAKAKVGIVKIFCQKNGTKSEDTSNKERVPRTEPTNYAVLVQSRS